MNSSGAGGLQPLIISSRPRSTTSSDDSTPSCSSHSRSGSGQSSSLPSTSHPSSLKYHHRRPPPASVLRQTQSQPSGPAAPAWFMDLAQHPLDLLPEEIWSNICRFMDLSTLWSLKDTCHFFRHWLRPLLIHRFLLEYAPLKHLFQMTRQRLDHYPPISPTLKPTVDTLNSGFRGSAGTHGSSSAAAGPGIAIPQQPPRSPKITFAPSPLALPMSPISLTPASIGRFSASSNPTSPLMERRRTSNQNSHQLSQLMDSQCLLEEKENAVHLVDELVVRTIHQMHHDISALVQQELMEEFHPSTSPADSPLPPVKYTDVYEEWAFFDPHLQGLAREQNLERFRAEVGRRGSGVISAQFDRWERKRLEKLRQYSMHVSKLWCIIGQRKFPFSHAENRAWKERRRMRREAEVPEVEQQPDARHRSRSFGQTAHSGSLSSSLSSVNSVNSQSGSRRRNSTGGRRRRRASGSFRRRTKSNNWSDTDED